MRVEPELPRHPKFLRLKRIAGERAMEFLVAIWGHCQSNQRGEFWAGADASYVEMICGWDGQEGALFKGLTECGKPGFVVVEKDGVRIHDWNEMNSQMVGNWQRNPFGRRGQKPTENPTVNRTDIAAVPASRRGGSKGGSGRISTEANDNPTVPPTGTPSGSHREASALSFVPSIVPSPTGGVGEGDAETAARLVSLLNALTGSKFNPPLHELDQITGRLLEAGRDVAGIERMLRRQVALWKNDPKARHWLKPGTLFGANFHDYYGQREQAVPGPNGSHGERVTKTGRPRGEILQALELARQSGVPEEIAALEEELHTA